MEFWGAEVKSGELFLVNIGDEKILHLSQACLGEVKGKGNEPVCLFVKVGNQKLVLGTLSSEKFPQISFDLVFDEEFELSHNWKHGIVYFTGYTSRLPTETHQSSDSDSEEDTPFTSLNNGKLEIEANQTMEPNTDKSKQKVKNIEPNSKDDEDDTTSVDEGEDSTDNENTVDSSDDDNNESDDEESDDEESDDTPAEDEKPLKKGETSKRRPLESANKTPEPAKKAKFLSPEKTDRKKAGGPVATPYPSKKAGKAPVSNDQAKQQTPKTAGGSHHCKSCNRSFGSDNALQSHTKAKHSDGK